MNGKQVVLVFPAPALGARVFPEDLGQFLTEYYREKGVEVVAQADRDRLRDAPGR